MRASVTLPAGSRKDFLRFSRAFRSARILSGLPNSVGMVPGCCRETPLICGSHSPGFSLGYGDLAQRIEKRPRETRRLFSEHNLPICDLFTFSSLGCVPEGSRTDSRGSGDPPGPDFERILRYFFAGSAGVLSGFVGFRRDVAGMHHRPPELTLRGSPWGSAISCSDLN